MGLLVILCRLKSVRTTSGLKGFPNIAGGAATAFKGEGKMIVAGRTEGVKEVRDKIRFGVDVEIGVNGDKIGF